MKAILFLLSFFLTATIANAQQKGVWNGKSCAVVLTYDDALDVHLNNAIPLLDSLGLRGTFYLSGFFPGFEKNIARWKAAAKRGHELANHTLFHPCLGNIAGRDWVKPESDLSRYTVQRMDNEIRMTNILLKTLDGQSGRTFAFPCGDTKINGVDYYKPIAGDFVAARGTTSEMKPITALDFNNIGSYAINGQTGEEMIELVKKARATHSLLVFLFHGVGGEHSLNVALPEHAKLLRYLKQQSADVWVAPFIDVARYARAHQTAHK
jgi:peptidoglycan/xylan/chitin deacetylase (PgdA/CDA1 family)